MLLSTRVGSTLSRRILVAWSNKVDDVHICFHAVNRVNWSITIDDGVTDFSSTNVEIVSGFEFGPFLVANTDIERAVLTEDVVRGIWSCDCWVAPGSFDTTIDPVSDCEETAEVVSDCFVAVPCGLSPD